MPSVIAFSILEKSDPAYRAGYLYRLERDYQHGVPLLGDPPDWHGPYLALAHLIGTRGSILTARAGYCWDGPSGPALDTVDFLRASLVHDCLYQLMRERVLPQGARPTADRLLREISIEDGMSRWRAWMDWIGVRLGAGPASHPRT